MGGLIRHCGRVRGVHLNRQGQSINFAGRRRGQWGRPQVNRWRWMGRNEARLFGVDVLFVGRGCRCR